MTKFLVALPLARSGPRPDGERDARTGTGRDGGMAGVGPEGRLADHPHRHMPEAQIDVYEFLPLPGI